MIIPSVTYKFSRLFEQQYGFEAVCLTKIPPSLFKGDVEKAVENTVLFFDYVAYAAGLGEIGKGKFFLTEEYGVRQYFAAILTDAEIECDEIHKNSICDGCMECAKACPYGAISLDELVFENIGNDRVGLEEMCGSFYGLDTAKGFDNMQYAVMAVIWPTGANPIGDMDSTGKISYESYNVISRICNSPMLQNIRVEDILNGTTSVLAMDVIAYTKFDYAKEGEHIAYAPGDEILTIRKDASPNSDGLYFSTHFGKSSGYHAHLDTATFVLDMLGERWAEDLGRDDYNIQQVLGYKSDEIYRMRAEGHNTLVINPSLDGGQKKQEYTKIDKYDANEYGGYVAADMSALYEDAQSVIPNVTVLLSDPECSYEVNQTSDKKATVKVYNKDKTEYILYVLNYGNL